jgi:hypothetical protein
MIATDPLSLVFIFCFLLGFGFFIASAFMGGHGHAHHSVGHAGGHAHVAHTSAHTATHAHTHAGSHTHAGNHTQVQPHTNGQQTGKAQTQQQDAQQGTFSLFAYLNPTSIALFLLGFGFSGYFFHNTTPIAASLLIILALVGGIIISAFVLFLLNRLFANSEGSTIQDVSDRTGMIGKVSITIPEKGLGEIIYTSPGGLRKSVPARGLENQHLDRDLEVVVVNYQNGVAEVDTWEHFMHEHDGTDSSDSSSLDELAQLRSLQNESSILESELVIRKDLQKE